MENAAEALKIAFAVLMFVLALTLSISSFSQATRAVGVITTLRDREAQYTYVKPINSENDFSRIVGIETVVSTIYRAPEQNLKIYFYDSEEHPICLYYAAATDGTLKKDANDLKIEMNYIDLTTGFNKANNSVEDFINALVGGIEGNPELEALYGERIHEDYKEGLYKKFANTQFLELLGEYEETEGASKVTHRIITFIKK